MTDTEQKRIKAICKVAHIDDISDLSDGYHTFKQLYYQRMMLFAALVKQNRDKAWKSLRHEDGELCFGGGWFIVGIDTPKGSYTYHYEDNFYSLFDCIELERGKHWDGHTEKDVTRLLSLVQEPCDCISREFIEIVVDYPPADLCTYPEYKGKPYFSIKYRENGKTYVGFGTYKIEMLSQWIKEYFIPSIQPKPKKECSCDQIKWERDTAIAQLKELGYGLGEKPKTDFEHKAEIVISQLRADRDRLQDALEKIKVEIKEWYWQADKQALAKDPCVVDAMVDLFIRTINKYTAESEG